MVEVAEQYKTAMGADVQAIDNLLTKEFVMESVLSNGRTVTTLNLNREQYLEKVRTGNFENVVSTIVNLWTYAQGIEPNSLRVTMEVIQLRRGMGEMEDGSGLYRNEIKLIAFFVEENGQVLMSKVVQDMYTKIKLRNN